MPDLDKFKKMTGCSSCVHATDSDPQGKAAAAHGASFWCRALQKPVETQDGATCATWQTEG